MNYDNIPGMEKDFTDKAGLYEHRIAEISVRHRFTLDDAAMFDVAGKLYRVEGHFLKSGLSVWQHDRPHGVDMRVLLKHRTISFELLDAGDHYPFEESEFDVEFLSPAIASQYKIAKFLGLGDETGAKLDNDIAGELFEKMKNGGFTFTNETAAKEALRDVASAWLFIKTKNLSGPARSDPFPEI